MNRSDKRSKSRLKQRAFIAAIVTGAVMLQPGCGIPQLRGAKPGQAMPETYTRPASTGSESVSWDVATAIPTENSTVDVTEESKPSEGGLIRLAGFLRQATKIEPNKSDDKDKTENQDEHGKPSEDQSVVSQAADDPISLFAPAAMPSVDSFDLAHTGENSGQFDWHQFFDDPFLAGLIDQALVGNQELRILAEEIQIACNETYARSGEYRPFVDVGAGVGLEKSGEHTRAGAVEDQLEVAPGRGFPDPLPDFLVGANVSWQLDIWKKLRNAQSAAAMRYLSTQEGRNYVVTGLVAEIAENYYELLALDNRLMTLDKTIEIQQNSLKTADAMKEAGRGTELAVQRFQAEVRKNQSEKLIIEQEIVEVENRINFLVGRYPQHVQRMSVEYIDLTLQSISAGVPAQLLQNRPDIRAAERELQAAGLDIKVAKARFYPSLNLNAGVGYQAFAAGYLFRTPESLIYSIGGDLVAPLINKRAIQAAYRTANAKQLQAVYNYQQTVLNAYTEVINQLTKVSNYGKSIEIKKQQLASLEASVDSATKLFQNARAEYVEVLLAQREMMEAKMLIIDIKQQQLSATIYAYQALGGSGGGPANFN